MYESLASCPDDLLLFMHHVPYTHVLHSGKTVIQYLYDSHYEGAEAVEGFVRAWKELAGLIDPQRHQEVSAQLEYQAGQAEVWRDAVSNWFLRASGIPDAKGRVGQYPGRMEAESARLEGYKPIDATPWESASGGKAVECAGAGCSATFRYEGAPGVVQVRVRYFDQNNGAARFRALLGDRVLDAWTANDRLPSRKIDSSSSALRVIPGVMLRPGEEIRIEGTPDGGETAALDYVEVLRNEP
jgi:alpha-glucuronidase